MPSLMLEALNSTAILVTWSVSGPGATPTGFVIYYDDGSTMMEENADSADREFTITDLQPGVTITATMVALSDQLPSEATPPQMISTQVRGMINASPCVWS